ncbi:HD family hydrolase [Clostridium sp. 19966]|uniref:HD family hydrolase n=1 Tax=Clostridium sp. 19966 TaxID=2768166 RepID=UPI0037BF6F1A
MEQNRFKDIINFVKEAEMLKDTERTAWTRNGRHESTAEHSWRLALFAMVLEEEFEDYDHEKIIKLCLIHDLGEIYEGDIPAIAEVEQEVKINQERAALIKLTSLLPKGKQEKLMELWEEYNACNTKESKLVKALDKIETIIQHNQGNNPEDFDYEFNLQYGKSYASFDEKIKAIREIIDRDTMKNIK